MPSSYHAATRKCFSWCFRLTVEEYVCTNIWTKKRELVQSRRTRDNATHARLKKNAFLSQLLMTARSKNLIFFLFQLKWLLLHSPVPPDLGSVLPDPVL